VLSGLAWSQPYSRYGQDLWATYSSSGSATVTFSIRDSAGRRVRDLGDDVPVGPGQHAVDWDGYADNATPVADGPYRLVLDAVDSDGTSESLSATITMDTKAPRVTVAPRSLKRWTTLVVSIQDRTSGVANGAVMVGKRIVARAAGGQGQLRYRPRNGWKRGRYTISVQASDLAGNRAYVTRTFIVKR
jgi:hypothetical protein